MADITKIAPFGSRARVSGEGMYRKVLVKFSFTNRAHIPEGILEKQRQNNATMDHQHALAAITAGQHQLAQPSRIRPGRVDTGEHFIDNIQNIHVGCLVRGLASANFGVTDIHWFYKRGEGGSSDKYVVVVTLEHREETVALPAQAIEQRRKLASTCWKYCHGLGEQRRSRHSQLGRPATRRQTSTLGHRAGWLFDRRPYHRTRH